jgi:non-specific protein-tyrosine kinase
MVTDSTSLSAGADDTIWLGEYLSVLRRRKWSILAITLLGTLGALFVAQVQTPIYESSAKVQASNGIVSSQSTAIDMGTEIAFVTSDVVAKCAELLLANEDFQKTKSEAALDLDKICSEGELASAKLDRKRFKLLEFLVLPQSTVMTVTYSDPSPANAQAAAEAFSAAYVQIRLTDSRNHLAQLRAPLEERQKSLSQEIAKLDRQIDDALNQTTANREEAASNQREVSNLEAQRSGAQAQLADVYQQLLGLDESKIVPPKVLLPAQLPLTPASPVDLIYGALGFGVALLLGIGVAFLRERLDDGIRGRQDVEASLGAPVLAVIPKVVGWKNPKNVYLITRELPKHPISEAYRSLRTGITFLASQQDAKVLLVASAGSGEGKTTTVANLAYVLAEAGRRVVVLSADLRKPRIHRFFQIDKTNGLSEVLANILRPWEAIQNPGVETLRIMPSGPIPSRPADLLQSNQMREVVAGLREVSDFVLIDSAPILLVADALTLAPLVDGVLFVADAGKTSRSEMAHAADQLEQVNARVIGAVLNNFDPARARAYRYYRGYGMYRNRYVYGYGTYGTYGYTSENGAKERLPAMEQPRERQP